MVMQTVNSIGSDLIWWINKQIRIVLSSATSTEKKTALSHGTFDTVTINAIYFTAV